MKYLKWAAPGILVLLALAFWLRASVLGEMRRFEAFCGATHRGEPWPTAQARAAKGGWAFVVQSAAGREPAEYLAQSEAWGYRMGCTVVVARGRVEETRFSELPRE